MNLYKKHIYRSHLEHAMPMNPRKNHKYLYIDKNGNYVYPEDVKRKVAGGFKKAGKAVQNVYNERETYKKAASEMYDAHKKGLEAMKYGHKADMQRQYEDRMAKSDKVKARNKEMFEGAKKVGKAVGTALLKGRSGRMMDYASDIRETGKEQYANYKEKEKKRQAKIQKEIDDSSKKANEEMAKAFETERNKYAKKKTKDTIDDYLPEGWERRSDGHIYDDLGAIVSEAELAALKKKKIAKR